MAVNIFNSLTFGTVNSADYGIYISGPGVYDAPARDIEFVNVPGRNGALEIDKGHWNNIEVKYTAGTFGDNQDMFAEKISAFRNAIASQIGYQRLTDTYNPEEYRLGIYASGLSVNPVARNAAGEFELVFNCKPQRFLVEGENPIQVTSGQTVTNPTLFDALPTIIVDGYGRLQVNDKIVEIDDGKFGEIVLRDSVYANGDYGEDLPITFKLSNVNLLAVGDEIRFPALSVVERWQAIPVGDVFDWVSYTYKSSATVTNKRLSRLGNVAVSSTFQTLAKSLRYGTRATGVNIGNAASTLVYNFGGSVGQKTFNCSGNYLLDYDGEDTITIRYSGYNVIDPRRGDIYLRQRTESGSRVIGDSTKDNLTHPIYIDLENGSAYGYIDGEIVSQNPYVDLGSTLPTLKAGTNSISFDNTITEVRLIPRWWKI